MIPNFLQIANMAQYDGLNEDSIWQHFVNVMIPAIQRWQVHQYQDQTDSSTAPFSLGELMVKSIRSVNHISEVILYHTQLHTG